MAQQGKRQVACMAQASEAGADTLSCSFQLIRTEVGHLPTFNVVPDTFCGIQVGRIGRQPFDLEPVALTGNELAHGPAAVGRKPIPDQDHRLSTDEATEPFEKADQAGGIETAFAGARKQPGLSAIPSEAQRRRHRHLLPMIAPRFQDRCLPAGRPRGADRGLLAESGFVLEEDPGLPPTSVFFTSGQRFWTQ